MRWEIVVACLAAEALLVIGVAAGMNGEMTVAKTFDAGPAISLIIGGWVVPLFIAFLVSK